MEFIEPLHSKNSVRRAGKIIGSAKATPEEVREAKEKVADYRSAHAYPLLSVTNHVRNKALTVSNNAIVAQRMKRLPTILDKLKRHPNMSITTMQDFGGCRVVLDSVEDVRTLQGDLYASKRAKNVITKEYDYISGDLGPRTSGYRGIHLIYEYRASKKAYHGYKIELQIRTSLQHSWATAVETMDLFSGTALKYSKGDEDSKRYFGIVSSLMAHHEGTSPVPGIEAEPRELRDELRELESRLLIVDRLHGYSAVVSEHSKNRGRSFLTLELNRASRVLQVNVHDSQTLAEQRLDDLEGQNDEDLDAVLIGIKQIGQLRAAYPNYFADTSKFVSFVISELRQ